MNQSVHSLIEVTANPLSSSCGDAVHEDLTRRLPAPSELIVNGLQGAAFWKQLYEIAYEHGTRAAENWTPSPMWVEGYPEAVFEGACGVAWIRLPDARSQFARWLKKNGLGYKGHKGGYLILADCPSQSLERACKYSVEFAAVLRLNGIKCDVGWGCD